METIGASACNYYNLTQNSTVINIILDTSICGKSIVLACRRSCKVAHVKQLLYHQGTSTHKTANYVRNKRKLSENKFRFSKWHTVLLFKL